MKSMSRWIVFDETSSSSGHLAAVREIARLERRVDAHHPLERRPGKCACGIFFRNFHW
jgi:hypothetical protein